MDNGYRKDKRHLHFCCLIMDENQIHLRLNYIFKLQIWCSDSVGVKPSDFPNQKAFKLCVTFTTLPSFKWKCPQRLLVAKWYSGNLRGYLWALCTVSFGVNKDLPVYFSLYLVNF